MVAKRTKALHNQPNQLTFDKSR